MEVYKGLFSSWSKALNAKLVLSMENGMHRKRGALARLRESYINVPAAITGVVVIMMDRDAAIVREKVYGGRRAH